MLASKSYQSIGINVKDINNLQSVINSCKSGTTLFVDGQTLTGSQIVLKDGVSLWGGIDSYFTPSSSPTVLDGNNLVLPLKQESDFTTTTKIYNITIKNGLNDGGNGGCASLKGGIDMESCIIDGGKAAHGGGMYVSGASKFNSCTVTGGEATDGGGMYVSGASTFSDCTVTGGKATDGGGMYVSGASKFNSCTVTGGKATHGGGIYVSGASTFSNCTVTGSESGGGMYINNACQIDKCIVKSNSGGGISIIVPQAINPNTVISNSLIAENTGRGIYISGESTSAITIYNCTIANNTSGEYSSGIVILPSNHVMLTNHVWITNNIVYGNVPSSGVTNWQIFFSYDGNTYPHINNNDVEGHTSNGNTYCGAYMTDYNFGVNGNTTIMSAPFGSDYKLISGSSSINKGLTTFDIGPDVPENSGSGMSNHSSKTLTSTDLDLAGKSRVQGTAPDRGCYEKE